MRDQRVRSGGIELAVRERGEGGEGDRPVVVLVHGYPDTGAMWDDVAERLAGRFRVITYDVRGAGGSSAPSDPLDYGLDALMGDLEAVLDGVGADRPVHLVGHDWGSVQGWEAVIGGRLRGRFASFTSISGPDRRHLARWVRTAVRSGPRGVREVLATSMLEALGEKPRGRGDDKDHEIDRLKRELDRKSRIIAEVVEENLALKRGL